MFRMYLRRLLRIALSLIIIFLIWFRAAKEWHEQPVPWLIGSLTLSVVLLLVVIMELTGALRKRRAARDQVPKRPLGLDS